MQRGLIAKTLKIFEFLNWIISLPLDSGQEEGFIDFYDFSANKVKKYSEMQPHNSLILNLTQLEKTSFLRSKERD